MTTYEDKGPKPEVGEYYGFDYIELWVSNAKQVASFYTSRLGFELYAYSGLETDSRQVATHVVKQNKIVLAFSSWLLPERSEMTEHVAKHGDGVHCVAFTVDDCEGVYNEAIKRGAVSYQAVTELTDENGTVKIAKIKTYGDAVHAFVERHSYAGCFLPGFRTVNAVDPLSALVPSPNLSFIDHVVGNQDNGEMVKVADWYENVLQFHRFWSVDDKQVHTEFSSLRSIVMASYNEKVKMPINEPAEGKRKSQIKEYVEYYGGAGVQHIAFNTPDIVSAVSHLQARGTEFLQVPSTYYTDLRARLANSATKVQEDLDVLQSLNILVDFDEHGYLLQIFTKPVEDRPTLFYEVIQRRNHQGFGAGNFKSLFEAIERDQAERGNLV